MEAAFSLSLDGKSLLSGLESISERLGDMTEVVSSAASAMRASVDANFAAGGRPESWAPLCESTVKRKGEAIPLYDSGSLRYGMHESHGPLHAKLTATAPYAAVQQHGDEHIPARPFMLIQPFDATYIRDMVAAHITAA